MPVAAVSVFLGGKTVATPPPSLHPSRSGDAVLGFFHDLKEPPDVCTNDRAGTLSQSACALVVNKRPDAHRLA